MRVLHVISGIEPENGGPPAVLLGMCRAQREAGLDVSVVATWQRPHAPQVAEQWQDSGVPVTLVGPATGVLSRHPDLTRKIELLTGRADIVHIHAVWEEIQHCAARAAHRLNVAYVITPHGMLDPWNMSHGRLKKRLYLAWRMRTNFRRAAAIHTATAIERRSIDRFGFGPTVLVEPFGVDLDVLSQPPTRDKFHTNWPALAGQPRLVVLYLGRLHPGKGLELLIPAFASIAPEVRGAVLVIAGPDSAGFQSRVEQMVRNAGVSDRVVFTGLLQADDRVAALAEADLLALPSYHENFGMVVAEALAAGTPVLVSDQVNLHPDVAAAGVGVVVRTEVSAVADALRHWLLDDALRRAAAERAAPFARERFNWAEIGRRWVDHYSRLLSPARRAQRANEASSGSTRRTIP